LSHLFDTNILLWALGEPRNLTRQAALLLDDQNSARCFSVTSLWEIVIKSGRGRADFTADAVVVRRALLESGFREISVLAEHTFAIRSLPRLHGDPFDRLLVAQAISENLTLVTADRQLAAYPAQVLLV
jgi:PIN domain nuclease of toxin-antitoxin system